MKFKTNLIRLLEHYLNSKKEEALSNKDLKIADLTFVYKNGHIMRKLLKRNKAMVNDDLSE